MILYLDTSALVKKYFREQYTESVLSVWQQATEIVISAVGYAEALSAFQRKKREAGLDKKTLDRIMAAFQTDWESFIRVAVSNDLNPEIDRLTGLHPLKGFDAIHLASALTIQKRLPEKLLFACFDRQLALAAQSEGLAILPPD